MKAETVIARMNEPTKYMKAKVFECQINFLNPEYPDFEDETSFDVDCTQPNWRSELLKLWEDFSFENNLPKDCVTDAWATPTYEYTD